ncbi:hypothetical protein AG1IA_04810 [Rhizoctonia solani AG-1 IA]|uniref:Uncharacterized protein n=1 Tax=Thanatephorus cucumeris (strain AG1-IA) TaxID=983506 RepID=L8WWG1_THACA|nr:hypothetical protein AG1IA_04810 [Rhizoctonia solani AG-1 IA]
MSGSQLSPKGSSPAADPLNFGLSPRFLSALNSLPATAQPQRAQAMSGLPSLNSQSTFTSGNSPASTLIDGNAAIDLASSGIPGTSPADEFKQNVSLVVGTFIPRVQELTRAIIHDLLTELQSILRQSGIGTLPLNLLDGTNNSASIRAVTVEDISASVSEAYSRATQCRANATIVQNVLEQEVPTRRAA